jgi:outer membrane murein-binding lipoprotein Lpp
VVAASVGAVVEGKFVNLLIGAAMVATLVAAGSISLDRRTTQLVEALEELVDTRLGDAYDTGKENTHRSITLQLAELTRSGD